MRFIVWLLALIGLGALAAVGYAAWTFRGFDPKAAEVYWSMAGRLAETGNAVEATVWRRRVDEGLSFEEVEESIRSVAAAENIRAVGELPLGDQVALMRDEDWRKLGIYLYCNPLTAAKMVEYSPAYSAWLPCRVALVEDAAGVLWLYSIDMDMMIHGGKPLPEALRSEALHVKEVILAILDGAAEGSF